MACRMGCADGSTVTIGAVSSPVVAPRLWPFSPLSRWSILLGAAAASLVLAWRPAVPDLAAQTAWADFVHRSGVVPVFADWYGGITLGNYSLLVPPLMSLLGVEVVGAVAGLASILVAARLLARTRNSALGLAAFAVADVANLICGRVTFAAGVALSLGALLLVVRRRRLCAALLGAAACLASPVAGVLLLVPLAAMVWCGIGRGGALVTGGAVTGTLGLLAWAFPLTGYEPFTTELFVVAVGIQLAAVLVSASRPVQVAATIGIVVIGCAYIVHSPLGGDVARLPVLLTPAVAVADAAVGRRTAWLLVALACSYPVAQVSNDILATRHIPAEASFTSGLRARLVGDPIARAHRVEVVDASTHWGAVGLSSVGIAVARGWLTQADEAQNPLFYGHALLDATSYRAFLDRTATAYVAVEHAAPLDSGAKAEAQLISRGLGYLHPVWSDGSWTLYRVAAPRPLATGVATVVRTTDTGVVLDAARPGLVYVDLNWSRYLTVDGGQILRNGSTIAVKVSSPGVHVVRGVWPWSLDRDSAAPPGSSGTTDAGRVGFAASPN